MKRKYYVFLAACLLIAILLWHFRPQPQSQQALPPPSGQTDEAQSEKAIPIEKSHSQIITNQSTVEEASARIEERFRQREIDIERGRDQWRTPIEFYGKIIDENESPVQGAQIVFSCTDLSAAGNSIYRTTSDANGLFSLNNVQGKLLVVRSIVKEGYYVSKRNQNNFFYAGENENFVPDFRNPVIFHLRKKGDAEPLIACRINFRIPRDGTPFEVDLLRCRKAAPGQGNFVVECWTDDQGKKRGEKYDWKCRVSIPGGGLMPNNEEFDFEAPLEGYEPTEEIEVKADVGAGWSNRAKRKYFLKLDNGNYGRLTFEMVAAGDHFFEIEYAINPSGSRNLEYNQAVQHKQTVFE